MGELIGSIQREVRPVKNALPTIKDITASKVASSRVAGLLGLRKDQITPGYMQAIALTGFASLIPDQIEASGVLKNPARIAALDAIKEYMVVLNDKLDFEGSGRQDIGELIGEIDHIEKYRRAELDKVFAALPDNEQDWVRSNTQTAIAEVEFVEAWIRQRQDANKMSFSDVDTYRSMVNAICEVIGAAIIFGPGHLQDKAAPIEGMLDIHKVIGKYAWITGTHPQNELERALMVAFNMGQVAQIIDDRNGLAIDQTLNVPTYTRAALKVTAGDKNLARSLVDSKQDEYKQKALDLGAGKITGGLITEFYKLAQVVHQRMPEVGRRHKLARRAFGRFHMGLREEAYMKGKI